MQRIEFRAMACHMLAVLESESRQATQAIGEVPAWFEMWEQALSRFRSDSELSHLNRHNGQWVEVGPVLWEVFQLGMTAAQDSAGLVIPTALAALEAAGYDRSFELVQTSFAAISVARSTSSDWRDIETDPARHAIHLPSGVRLDLGGVAKGWAADEAARRLSVYGAALVDAGGDIAVAMGEYGGDAFPVGVASPTQPDGNIDLLMLKTGGVATSGRDYRRWQRNGIEQHHIIDPRTSLPAMTNVLSATAVAPSAREAEVAAKVALILGSAAGLAWIESQPSSAALLAMDDGAVLRSSRFSQYAWHDRVEVEPS